MMTERQAPPPGTEPVHHAYNDVVATHYDRDPQGVIGRSLDLGIAQLRAEGLFDESRGPIRVLDIGMGTGEFLVKLKAIAGDRIIPFGLDLAEKMVEAARRKIPDLTAMVADANDVDAVFPGETFDCVCTHFITGYVGIDVLAPGIFRRLKPGGFYSLVGGTKRAYAALQAKGDSRFLRWVSGAGSRRMDDAVLNPADLADVEQRLKKYGFEIRAGQTFEPDLSFPDFDRFMEFGYQGGWLTPLIESMGLHRAGPAKRWLLNSVVFPVQDRHHIAIALGRKP